MGLSGGWLYVPHHGGASPGSPGINESRRSRAGKPHLPRRPLASPAFGCTGSYPACSRRSIVELSSPDGSSRLSRHHRVQAASIFRSTKLPSTLPFGRHEQTNSNPPPPTSRPTPDDDPLFCPILPEPPAEDNELCSIPVAPQASLNATTPPVVRFACLWFSRCHAARTYLAPAPSSSSPAEATPPFMKTYLRVPADTAPVHKTIPRCHCSSSRRRLLPQP